MEETSLENKDEISEEEMNEIINYISNWDYKKYERDMEVREAFQLLKNKMIKEEKKNEQKLKELRKKEKNEEIENKKLNESLEENIEKNNNLENETLNDQQIIKENNNNENINEENLINTNNNINKELTEEEKLRLEKNWNNSVKYFLYF